MPSLHTQTQQGETPVPCSWAQRHRLVRASPAGTVRAHELPWKSRVSGSGHSRACAALMRLPCHGGGGPLPSPCALSSLEWQEGWDGTSLRLARTRAFSRCPSLPPTARGTPWLSASLYLPCATTHPVDGYLVPRVRLPPSPAPREQSKACL